MHCANNLFFPLFVVLWQVGGNGRASRVWELFFSLGDFLVPSTISHQRVNCTPSNLLISTLNASHFSETRCYWDHRLTEGMIDFLRVWGWLGKAQAQITGLKIWGLWVGAARDNRISDNKICKFYHHLLKEIDRCIYLTHTYRTHTSLDHWESLIPSAAGLPIPWACSKQPSTCVKDTIFSEPHAHEGPSMTWKKRSLSLSLSLCPSLLLLPSSPKAPPRDRSSEGASAKGVSKERWQGSQTFLEKKQVLRRSKHTKKLPQQQRYFACLPWDLSGAEKGVITKGVFHRRNF